MRLILDHDLAALYGVTTKVLMQAVRRNLDRFPQDFLLTLENHEVTNLRSQIVTSSLSWGGRRYSINAFTEHGAIMAATVLKSTRAIAASIFVVRAFVAMRAAIAIQSDLAKRLDQLEKRVAERLGAQDQVIEEILEAIRSLAAPPEKASGQGIGFVR